MDLGDVAGGGEGDWQKYILLNDYLLNCHLIWSRAVSCQKPKTIKVSQSILYLTAITKNMEIDHYQSVSVEIVCESNQKIVYLWEQFVNNDMNVLQKSTRNAPGDGLRWSWKMNFSKKNYWGDFEWSFQDFPATLSRTLGFCAR